jgi:hypothetical protein
MFKNLARTLLHIALSRAAVQPAQLSHHVPVNSKGHELSARELSFTGRGHGGKKFSHKKGNAAQLKRASKKASNIRKWG